jgi:hypothetical protein
MGWWAKEIMSGDSPLDVEDEIFGIMQIEKYPDTPHPENLVRDTLNEMLPVILQNKYVTQDCIGKQVLGHVIITEGGQMDEATRSLVLEGCDEDDWAKEDDERARIIREFREKVVNYTGEKVSVKRTGLFEKIANHLAEGKTGLVNENGPM